MFNWLKRTPKPDPVAGLHARTVKAALEPALYLHGGIEDSFEGRFESLALHAFLVMRRLNALPPPAPEMAQELVDRTFTGIDHTLRQIGISDTRVPKKMKELASAFLGRVAAYDAGFAAEGTLALQDALSRNALSGRDASLMAEYAAAAAAHLAELNLEHLLRDADIFPRLIMDEGGPT
jgi:cytochrome b pre-mRNA-processing protein 3